nr:unnamed protein product [Spirometra erinaceieuropaei]
MAAYTYEMGHEFNFAVTKTVVHTGNKTGREVVGAWVSVNQFIDLAPAYGALRSHLQSFAVDWPACSTTVARSVAAMTSVSPKSL